MNYCLVENRRHNFLEAFGQAVSIGSESDALDWVALCGESKINRLLLNDGCLAADFYHLSTGLAGAILLKFSIYRIRVALISTPARVNQGKFQEMAMETNRGTAFRIFFERDQAVDWLTSD
jgi:PadR family transcriptional regulator, regulatory protein AphA